MTARAEPPRPPRRRSALFLERQSYRRRRVRDALRLLPVIGLVLWAVPLLWSREATRGAVPSSTVLMYVFGVWAVLILSALLLARRQAGEGPDEPGGGAPE